MMDEKQFEVFWEQEERLGIQQRLRQDYPAWQRRRKQRMTLVCIFAVLMVVGVSAFNFLFPISKGYDYVACNRGGIPNGHWAEVASNILISNCEI